MMQRIYGVLRCDPGDYYSEPSERLEECYTTRELAERAIDHHLGAHESSLRTMGLSSGAWDVSYEIVEIDLHDSLD